MAQMNHKESFLDLALRTFTLRKASRLTLVATNAAKVTHVVVVRVFDMTP